MRPSLVPDELPIATAAHIAGKCDRDFRSKVIRPGLVDLSPRGRVTRESLERHLGFAVTPERFLAADRQRDAARRYQRDYRDGRKMETAHVA